MNKKVLIISAAAPPNGGSHAQRIVSLVKYFHKNNYYIDIIIPQKNSEQKEESSLYNEMASYSNVIEVRAGGLRSAVNKISKTKEKLSFLSSSIQKLRAFVRRNSMPDTYISWVPYVLKKVKNLNDNYDMVVSSGAPFSSHIAAYLISKKYNIPLALDYGDPWVYEPGRERKGFRLFIERKIEKNILSQSYYVSVTTNETATLYENKYNELELKIGSHYMGFDKDDFLSEIRTDEKNKKYEIVYAGRINEEYRTLGYFINFLEAISNSEDGKNNIRVSFYGDEFDSIIPEVKKYIEIGLLNINSNLEHKSYIEKIRTCDALIIFGNNSLVQIPGKVVHFLAARKKILYFPNKIKPNLDPSITLINKCLTDGLIYIDSNKKIEEFINNYNSNNEITIVENQLINLDWDNVFNGFELK